MCIFSAIMLVGTECNLCALAQGKSVYRVTHCSNVAVSANFFTNILLLST